MRVLRTVREHQRQARATIPARGGVGTVEAFGHPQVFLLAQRKVRLDRIDLRNRREECRRADQVADLRGGDGGHSVDERHHLREADVELRGIHGGLGRLDRCLGGEVGLYVVVQLALGDRPLFGERPVALKVALRPADLCLRFGKPRLGLREGGIECPRIDFEQELALVHDRTFFIDAANQIAGYLRANLRVDVAVERRDPLARQADPLGRQDDHADLGRRGRHGRGRGVPARLE